MNKEQLEEFNTEMSFCEPSLYLDSLLFNLEQELDKLELNKHGILTTNNNQSVSAREIVRVNGQIDIVKAIQKALS